MAQSLVSTPGPRKCIFLRSYSAVNPSRTTKSLPWGNSRAQLVTRVIDELPPRNWVLSLPNIDTCLAHCCLAATFCWPHPISFCMMNVFSVHHLTFSRCLSSLWYIRVHIKAISLDKGIYFPSTYRHALQHLVEQGFQCVFFNSICCFTCYRLGILKHSVS